jgi:hypothetical protein
MIGLNMGKNVCWHIVDYEARYLGYNKRGDMFKGSQPWIKLPVKPSGKGLRKLLRTHVEQSSKSIGSDDEHPSQKVAAMAVFGIWCLILEDTTENRPEMRGYLVNHKDQPADIEEIAEALHMEGEEPFIESALMTLEELNWMEKVEITSQNCEEGSNSLGTHFAKCPVRRYEDDTKKKTKTKTKTVDEEEEKPKPDGDIVEKSFEPIGSLSSEAKPVSEAQAWMVLHDVLDRVFRQMGEPLTSGDHTTFKRHVFEPHWELIGPNRWKDRVEELATVAQLAKGSKNIKACFMSEQKRKYLGSPNEDALKGL